MLITKLNNQQIEVCSEWSDFTLATTIKLKELEMPLFESVFDTFEHFDKVKQAIILLSGFHEKTIEQTNPESLAYLYWTYLHPFVLSLSAPFPEIEYNEIATFKVGDNVYFLPENLSIDDNVILQHNQTARPFCEATDLLRRLNDLQKEGWKAMPLFISTIVKDKPSEVWNETRVIERAEELKAMDMQTFWDVFFCIVGLWNKYNRNALNSLLVRAAKRRSTLIGLWRWLKAKWRVLLRK
jgi:hypothetical protein